jgi:hypothetical protein
MRHSKDDSAFLGTRVADADYGTALLEGERMKYGVAWLLGVPVSIIALWFVAGLMGCGG